MSKNGPMRPTDLPARYADKLRASDWIAQPKYDGWYVIFHDGKAYTRTGEPLSDWAIFTDRICPGNAVGEMWSMNGRNAVSCLRTDPTGGRISLFDVPGPEPIEERLAKLPDLAALVGWHDAPIFSYDSWEAYRAAAEEMMAIGHEGLVLKRRGSAWQSGDCADWRRMKRRDL